ncbi:MAG: CBS domain-containing protein [Methanobacteriaceae archaeon]|nr:CBS domain-containing protein [Methanobacteriaceae archaeon]
MYLTEFIKKPIYDKNNKKVGKIKDIICSQKKYPRIEALKIKISPKKSKIIPLNQLKIEKDKIELNSLIEYIKEYTIDKKDINISENILDRQIVDIEGKKIRRVNDIKINYINGQYYILGVDIGTKGLLRRLGLSNISEKLDVQDNIISWEEIDTLDYSNLKLKVQKQNLKKLHPADIADIVDSLGLSDSMHILHSLDDESAADAFEEISPEKQKTILTEMEKKEAAELIDEMSPDDAADLLASLPARKKEEILLQMDPLESRDLRELLLFPENTAGGIMTIEYAAVNENITTAELFLELKNIAADVETLYYIYVLSENKKLKGVLSIRQLFLAENSTPIKEYMNTDYVAVTVDEDQYDVAKIIAKYNLIALPVLDNEGIMKGIVTIDDAIDIVLPTAWKKRIPRMFR